MAEWEGKNPVFHGSRCLAERMRRLREWAVRTHARSGPQPRYFFILNGILWRAGTPARLHDVNVFSAGFILGMLGMYIAAWLYGYRRLA